MKVKNLNSHIEHIVNGYKQQYQFYKELLLLAVQQGVLIFDKSIDELQETFQKRNEIGNYSGT